MVAFSEQPGVRSVGSQVKENSHFRGKLLVIDGSAGIVSQRGQAPVDLHGGAGGRPGGPRMIGAGGGRPPFRCPSSGPAHVPAQGWAMTYQAPAEIRAAARNGEDDR